MEIVELLNKLIDLDITITIQTRWFQKNLNEPPERKIDVTLSHYGQHRSGAQTDTLEEGLNGAARTLRAVVFDNQKKAIRVINELEDVSIVYEKEKKGARRRKT